MKSLFYRREDERLNNKRRCGQGFRRATVLVASLGVAVSLMGAAIPAQAEVPPLAESSASDVSTPPAADTPAKSNEAKPTASAAEAPASIAGFVFDDKNHNGVPDPGEPGIAGVRVLPINRQGEVGSDTQGNAVPEQVTGVDGKYQFSDLAPDGYVVRTTLPDSDNYIVPIYHDVSDKRYEGIVRLLDIKAGETGTINYDARLADVSLGGQFFEDLNRNGILDPGEPSVAGGNTSLYANKQPGGVAKNAAGEELASLHSGVDGLYGFKHLDPDSFRVSASAPAGYEFNQAAHGPYITVYGAGAAEAKLTLGSPSKVENVNFALVKVESNPSSEISGTVYEDLNADGKWQLGEPGLVGAKIVLLDENSNPVQETTTRDEGRYLFYDLPGGVYRIKFVAPAGYSTKFTQPTSDGVTEALTIGPGTLNKKHDAGLIRLPVTTSGVAGKTLIASGELANTGAAGTITGFAVGGGLLIAGAASVFFARRRREE